MEDASDGYPDYHDGLSDAEFDDEEHDGDMEFSARFSGAAPLSHPETTGSVGSGTPLAHNAYYGWDRVPLPKPQVSRPTQTDMGAGWHGLWFAMVAGDPETGYLCILEDWHQSATGLFYADSKWIIEHQGLGLPCMDTVATDLRAHLAGTFPTPAWAWHGPPFPNIIDRVSEPNPYCPADDSSPTKPFDYSPLPVSCRTREDLRSYHSELRASGPSDSCRQRVVWVQGPAGGPPYVPRCHLVIHAHADLLQNGEEQLWELQAFGDCKDLGTKGIEPRLLTETKGKRKRQRKRHKTS
jgi:hypothetical protein